jgi:hypothetical protein
VAENLGKWLEEFPSQSAALVKRLLGRKPIYYHNNDINTKELNDI